MPSICLEATFRGSSAAMCVCDSSGVIVGTNEAFDARLDARRGSRFASVFAEPADQQAAASRMSDVFAAAAPIVVRGPCVGAEGSVRLSWSCRSVGSLVLATVDDAADRAAAEHELLAKGAELDALLRGLSDLYFHLDADGRIVRWYAGQTRELYVPPEAFIGRRPQDILPPEVAPTVAAAIDKALVERRMAVAEYTLATPSGDDQFEARLVPCGEREASAIIRNTTAQRRAEAALRASEERLRASQKLEAVGRLAGGVAHDFNNLLTVVLGRLQLLKRAENLLDGEREHVTEALDAASHAVSLTRQLLAFSRGQVMQPRVLDPNAVLGATREMLLRVAGEHIHVVLTLDPTVGPIEADPIQIEQVILNLVLNARDAMRAGGTLAISTREVQLDAHEASQRDGARPGAYVELSVTDSGCGMPPEVMAHLFEPFFTTKPHGEGTGLGLATVYGIVKQSGGHAVVRSAAGSGSTFALYFPRAHDEAAQAPHDLAPQSRPHVAGAGEVVLVVEDEEGVRRLVVDILRKAGYQALSAEGGDEALGVLREEAGRPISLLLSDVVMPRMNGRSLAARVQETWPHVRVLLMSGHDETAGGNLPQTRHYPIIQKPFTEQLLLARLREVLDGPPPHGMT